MHLWTEYLQNYIISGGKDIAALKKACSKCKNNKIRKLLVNFQVKDPSSYENSSKLIKELEAGREKIQAIVLRLFIYQNIFLILESLSSESEEQRISLFQNIKKTVEKIAIELEEYEELLPSAAYLYNLIITGAASIGNYSAQIEAYEKLLNIYQKVASKKLNKHWPGLGTVLNNYGLFLYETSDFPKAQNFFEKAIQIRRKLAIENPDTYLPELIRTFINVSLLYTKVRKFPLARNVLNEALNNYSNLVSNALRSCLPELAMIYNNLGLLSVSEQDFPAAEKEFRKSLKIKHSLAIENSNYYLPDLARGLINLGSVLVSLQDFDAALKATEEGIEIQLKLAKKNPNLYEPDLSMSFNNLGNIFYRLRKFLPAQEAYEKALKIRQKLVIQSPRTYSFDLSMTLNNLGALFAEVRDFTAAREVLKEALSIRHKLATDSPNAYLTELAESLNNYGVLLHKMLDFNKALEVHEEAIYIRNKLVSINPNSNLPRLAESLNNYAAILVDAERFEEAIEAYKRALEIRKILADKKPAIYLPCLALTLNNLAAVLRNANQLHASLKLYEEAIDIRKKLVEANPNVHLPELVMALNNLGILLVYLSDIHAARNIFEKAVYYAENFDISDKYKHLSKINVVAAYHFLLEEAINSNNFSKAFSLFAALHDGQVCANSIRPEALYETQNWLKNQKEKNGTIHTLIVSDVSILDRKILLGLIEEDTFNSTAIKLDPWEELFQEIESGNPDPEKCQELSYMLWEAFPNDFRKALVPEKNKEKFIIISGDHLLNNFPWELIRFGKEDEDYLGLHYSLPRIRSIQSQDLETQFCFSYSRESDNKISILAPFDTSFPPLSDAVDEIELVKDAANKNGNKLIAFAKGSEASNLEIDRQLGLQPDLFYYCGHGTIIQNEELLALHLDMSLHLDLSSTTFFGKENMKGSKLFPQNPLIVLNSCFIGRTRQAGGLREDLTSMFLLQGARAVIATPTLLEDKIGKNFGEALFYTSVEDSDIGSMMIRVRNYLAKQLQFSNINSFWGAWGMLHLHGNSRANLPFKQILQTKNSSLFIIKRLDPISYAYELAPDFEPLLMVNDLASKIDIVERYLKAGKANQIKPNSILGRVEFFLSTISVFLHIVQNNTYQNQSIEKIRNRLLLKFREDDRLPTAVSEQLIDKLIDKFLRKAHS